MTLRMRFSGGTLAILMAFVIAPAALASHGRVGLWSDTITMGGANPAMPDISKLPSPARAQMEAMGMSIKGNSITTQHCMTAQEVATDTPHLDATNAQGCSMSNVSHSGQTMSADLTCTGRFNGKGHMQFTYDSDSHYSGELTMTGTANGRPIERDQKFDGHWVSTDCGSVGH